MKTFEYISYALMAMVGGGAFLWMIVEVGKLVIQLIKSWR